jgi:hypothetical protein
MVLEADVGGAGIFALMLGFGLGRGLDCELAGYGETEGANRLGVDAETGEVALVVANLAAIGGKLT